jgi:hypothetical protein
LLLLLACYLPAQQVTLPRDPIVFGDAFELTVTARAEFDPGRLSPLVVELLDRTPAGTSQQWRFRARSYQVGEITLSLDPPVKLTIATSLPDPAGELEWPSEGWLIEPKQSFLWLGIGLLGVVATFLLWLRFLRVAPVAPVKTAAVENRPQWDALTALRELLPPNSGSYESYYQQLKAIVRRHCHVRFRVPADVRTSEELVLTLPNVQPTLQPCLSACDVALFGGEYGSGQNHQDAKDQAIAFVAATRAAAMPIIGAAQ